MLCGCLTQPFFLRALEATDMMHVLTLEEVAGEFTAMLRPPAVSIVIELMEARFREKPRDEWMRILQGAGVPKGPVGERNEWFRDETVAANDMRVVLEHPKLGPVEMPGP